MYQRTTSNPPTDWELINVDLSDYVGGDVTISFDLFATTVVERAGWYIDDVLITGNAVPEPSSIALVSLGAFGLLVRRRR